MILKAMRLVLLDLSIVVDNGLFIAVLILRNVLNNLIESYRFCRSNNGISPVTSVSNSFSKKNSKKIVPLIHPVKSEVLNISSAKINDDINYFSKKTKEFM